MHVERDIAGITIPFTVGVLLTVYLGAARHQSLTVLQFITSGGLLISVMMLLMRGKSATNSTILQVLIAACFSLCGILAGVTGLNMDIEFPISAVEEAALGFCKRMQQSIDSIPFESAGTGALVKALLTGDRTSLSADITQAFRDSGASHILALSGLHLGIIYGILGTILSACGNSLYMRRIRSVTVMAVCTFYTLATGAGPSITRALIFILLGETARLMGRPQNLGQIFLSALLIQLVISPMSVRSIGFQLSYAAIAGIAYIYPWLRGFWPDDEAVSPTGRIFGRAMRWIWNSLALSISCQITTGPLAYMYFSTFPQHFLLTNLIALPLTGLLIPSALLTLCMSCLGCCPAWLAAITDFLAQTTIHSLHIISTM